MKNNNIMAGRAQYNMVHNICTSRESKHSYDYYRSTGVFKITTLQNKPKIDTLKCIINFYTKMPTNSAIK